MSDSQMPDLSGFSNPDDLPMAKPLHSSRAVDPSTFPDPPRGRQVHQAAIQDTVEQNTKVQKAREQMQANQHVPTVDDYDDSTSEEEFRGGSMMSHREIEEMIQSRDAQESRPVPQSRDSRGPRTPPPSLSQQTPAALRDISELFTLGAIKQDIVINGFKLTIKSLSSDEYGRAWTMACMHPDGIAREVALRQYLLAMSCLRINGNPTEQLCTKTDITDPIARRVDVFSKIDAELLRRFYENGYAKIRDSVVKVLDGVNEEAGEVGNFTQPTR